MAISPELLNILRCPRCKSELQVDEAETRLKCLNVECSLVYPIRDEIPVMLVEEATRKMEK
ncbi:MAG: Trm112 family protein [Chloracidobacterium sp.]|nr:Trm112 family protein [Chloracidobacterium sp.]